MSARPHTPDGDSFGTSTLYAPDYAPMTSTYANEYVYAGNDFPAYPETPGPFTPAYGNYYPAAYVTGYSDAPPEPTRVDYPYQAVDHSYRPADAWPERDGYPDPAGDAYRDAYRETYRDTAREPRGRGSRSGADRPRAGARPSRRGDSPATMRIPARRPAPPEVRQVSSTPLLLRATVVIGLLVAAGVGVFRAYGEDAPPVTANLGGGGGATAVSANLGGGTTTVAADTGATVEGSCRVRQSMTSKSSGRFTSVVTIDNTGRAAVDGWTLTWSYPGTDATTVPRLGDGWNATVSSDINGGQATATDLSRVIPAGGTMTIGFVGAASGKVPTPANFALNGVTCR